MIKKYFSTFIVSTAMVLSALLMPSLSALPVQAQSTTANCNSSDCVQSGLDAIGQAYPAGAKQEKDLPSILHKIINWALYIAAIAAVIMIIIGGYMYIFSMGDQTKAGKGRTTMTNALIGLTLIVLSYMIVQIVYKFLTDPH